MTDAGEKMLTEAIARIDELVAWAIRRDALIKHRSRLAEEMREYWPAVKEALATIKRLETERDWHLAFINTLADEQRPSGRMGDHPTDTARAAREHLK